MAVPEASVHEYDLLAGWEHEIGLARQILAMKPEAESQLVAKAPDPEFRRGVSVLDRPHGPGPIRRCQARRRLFPHGPLPGRWRCRLAS